MSSQILVMVHSRPPICWESYHEKDRLQVSSSEASKVASVYCHLDSKVASTSADSPDGVYFRHKFEALQKKLKKLKALDVSWIGPLSGQMRFSVTYFSNLEYLRIEGCPPSSIFGSFNAHLHRLKIFSITDCVGVNLPRLLLPWRSNLMSSHLIDGTDDSTSSECKADVDRSYCWQSLSTLRVSKCGLSVMDNTLHYLPVVTDIDFSNNDITEILHLQDCYQLETLNLSRNSIMALPNISDALGNISTLNISYNHIESLHGIEKLSALRTLDISYNHISDFKEIVYLIELTSLENLHLLGNPISLPETKNGRAPGVAVKTLALMVYRKLVLKHLLIDDLLFDTGRTLPIVDYKLVCKAELQTFRSMAFKDIDTDLKVCCSSIIEKSGRPSPLTLSPISADPAYPNAYPYPSGTWCNSSTNSPTMFNTYNRNKSFLSANDFYLSHEGSRRYSPIEECSRMNSPIEECSRTNSPINSPRSTTHNSSGKEPKSKNKNSHIFSFSSQKKITSTWNYSRNSSPTGNQQQLQRFFDESINDEMGRRRRGSGIVRIEREYEYDDHIGDDLIFSLQKLKENLYNAERRLSIK